MKRLVRALAVAGVVAASSYYGTAADANHSVSFTDCGDAEPTPPAPTPTPVNPPSPIPTTAPTPKPTPTPVPQDCTPESGERVAGTRDVRFVVNAAGNRIHHVRLKILADEAAVKSANGGNSVFERNFAGDDRPTGIQVYDYSWDSVKTTPLNGKYKLEAFVSTTNLSEGAHDDVETRNNMRVDNPPVAVGAPEIVASTTNSNTIKWNKAKEADVQSYTVYRAQTKDAKTAPSADKLKAIAVVTATEYRDTKVGEGVFWYAIRVTRRSVVTPEEGISSPLSNISSGATVKAAPSSGPEAKRRAIPYRQLSTVRGKGRPPPVPDAPYSAYLPYDDAPESGSTEVEEPGDDPRGPVLPVAVGAFLVSSALALGRMPY
jgi:hypothetical protein